MYGVILAYQEILVTSAKLENSSQFFQLPMIKLGSQDHCALQRGQKLVLYKSNFLEVGAHINSQLLHFGKIVFLCLIMVIDFFQYLRLVNQLTHVDPLPIPLCTCTTEI